MSQSTIESKNKNSSNRGKEPAKETILTPDSIQQILMQWQIWICQSMKMN